jgi:hypothetical protein
VIYFNSLPKASHTFVASDGNYNSNDLINDCSIDSLQVSLAFGAGIFDLNPGLWFSLGHMLDD